MNSPSKVASLWPQYTAGSSVQKDVVLPQSDSGAYRTASMAFGPSVANLHAIIADPQISVPPSPVRPEVMAEPTREEIDAKLATIEARTETRFTELSGKIDRVANSINSLTGAVAGVRRDNNFTRWTIAGLVIAGVAAICLTQSNMLASFMAGITLHDAQTTSVHPPTTPQR